MFQHFGKSTEVTFLQSYKTTDTKVVSVVHIELNLAVAGYLRLESASLLCGKVIDFVSQHKAQQYHHLVALF